MNLRRRSSSEWSLYAPWADTVILESMRSTAMPGWLSLVCAIAVILSAAYLLLVILRPEKF